MITNREISSRALFEEALDELVESARENDVPDETLAEVLRTRASGVDEGGSEESSEPDGSPAAGDVQR
ncbi:hypothetical protein [Halobaculum magnesiiphilum]|uniref:Uncharacterized protein n=1 Tax=Halobaculum magnesiiphilum TaxID=1017351 RepID=A0A8T8WF11_9EURY|nr:hypothetical protein [Halobaculum magnesiiphilum]QZP38324.1 hypothetical protein K6T50_04025 [Halobaculum magnesiiphilum]